MRVAIVNNILQQFVVYFKFHSFYVFVVFQGLPLEAFFIVSVYCCNEYVCVLVTFPGVVVKNWQWGFFYLFYQVTCLLQHLPFGVLLVVFIFGHSCGKGQGVGLNWSSELYIEQKLGFLVGIFDDRDDIDALDYIVFVGCSENLFVVVDSLFSNCVVDVLHAKKSALVDDLFFDDFTVKIFFHSLHSLRYFPLI